MDGGALDAWVGVVGVAVGALFALGGVALSERGHQQRAKQTAAAALNARAEDRRAELWAISLPAAGRVQDRFGTMMRVARRDYTNSEEDSDFDEEFSQWWKDERLGVQRDIALIPSAAYRNALVLICEGVDYAGYLAAMHGWSHRGQVQWLSQLGFDVASAWMRDEMEMEMVLQGPIDELTQALKEVYESLEAELEIYIDPKGYGRSARRPE